MEQPTFLAETGLHYLRVFNQHKDARSYPKGRPVKHWKGKTECNKKISPI